MEVLRSFLADDGRNKTTCDGNTDTLSLEAGIPGHKRKQKREPRYSAKQTENQKVAGKNKELRESRAKVKADLEKFGYAVFTKLFDNLFDLLEGQTEDDFNLLHDFAINQEKEGHAGCVFDFTVEDDNGDPSPARVEAVHCTRFQVSLPTAIQDDLAWARAINKKIKLRLHQCVARKNGPLSPSLQVGHPTMLLSKGRKRKGKDIPFKAFTDEAIHCDEDPVQVENCRRSKKKAMPASVIFNVSSSMANVNIYKYGKCADDPGAPPLVVEKVALPKGDALIMYADTLHAGCMNTGEDNVRVSIRLRCKIDAEDTVIGSLHHNPLPMTKAGTPALQLCK